MLLIVVYRTIPTSNHNEVLCFQVLRLVVYRTIPTSNHNKQLIKDNNIRLYIVLFLHQTTTLLGDDRYPIRCISYYSYIKPQQAGDGDYKSQSCISYYSYIKPQLVSSSGHSQVCCISYYSYIKPQLTLGWIVPLSVVYRTIPTSNHNLGGIVTKEIPVVYRTIPTSNHN